MSKRAVNSKMISQTPVTSYQNSTPGGAPKKRVLYLSRIQTPPPDTLHEEWNLDSGRVWGYAFNYDVNELCFYQLEKGETFGPLTAKATLTSTDWAVLTLLVLNNLKAATSEEPATKDKETQTTVRIKQEVPPVFVPKKIVSCSVWETKSSASGRWFYRASHQKSEGDEALDEFVLQYFNTECGVFQTSLRIPVEVWMEMMFEKAEKLKDLFKKSQTSWEILQMKKTLTFTEDSSSNNAP